MNPIAVSDNLEGQSFAPRTAWAMSLWCFGWLVVLAANYLELTWRFISELGGFHWILIVSPSFWLWLSAFAMVLVVVHRLMQMPWHRFEPGLNLTKAGGLIVALPVVLWLTLYETIPYFYPAVGGFVRLVPFLGGKGCA